MLIHQEERLPLLYISLMALCGILGFNSCDEQQSFEAALIRVDTAAVSSILINPKGKHPGITFKREGKIWISSRGNISVRALPDPVNQLLSSLSLIKTDYLAAKQADAWEEYGVTQTNSTRVRVFQNEKLLEDFLIGRFSASEAERNAVSYLRLAGEDEVYAVNGFQALPFTRHFNSYRNPLLLSLKPERSLIRLDYHRADTVFSFIPKGEQRQGKSLLAVDSAEIEAYCRKLHRVEGHFFADRFDEMQAGALPRRSLVLHGADDSVTVTLYRDSTRDDRPFILYSSQYPDTFFASDSTGLYKEIFAQPERWIQSENGIQHIQSSQRSPH